MFHYWFSPCWCPKCHIMGNQMSDFSRFLVTWWVTPSRDTFHYSHTEKLRILSTSVVFLNCGWLVWLVCREDSGRPEPVWDEFDFIGPDGLDVSPTPTGKQQFMSPNIKFCFLRLSTRLWKSVLMAVWGPKACCGDGNRDPALTIFFLR